MRTIETKWNGKFELTEKEYMLVSWFATVSINTPSEHEDERKQYWQMWGIEAAGLAAEIPWQLFYDIRIEKRVTQYRNMNRLTEIVFLNPHPEFKEETATYQNITK